MCCDQNQPVINYSCWPAAQSYVTIELLHCATMPVKTKDNQLDKCSDMYAYGTEIIAGWRSKPAVSASLKCESQPSHCMRSNVQYRSIQFPM